MKITGLSRTGLGNCAAIAILAGCGGSQPPIGSPGTLPQARLPQGAVGPDTVVEFAYLVNHSSDNVSAYKIERRRAEKGGGIAL